MLCMCAAVQRRHKESMQNTANAFFVLFQAHLKKWIEVITTGSTQSQQVAAKTSHSPEDVSQFAGREIENYRVRCPSMNPLLKWMIESAIFSIFWVWKKNSQILPFKWNSFSGTFTWYYLFFSILQNDRKFFFLRLFLGAKGFNKMSLDIYVIGRFKILVLPKTIFLFWYSQIGLVQTYFINVAHRS